MDFSQDKLHLREMTTKRRRKPRLAAAMPGSVGSASMGTCVLELDAAGRQLEPMLSFYLTKEDAHWDVNRSDVIHLPTL